MRWFGGCDRVATDVGDGGCDRVATDVGNDGCDRVATDVCLTKVVVTLVLVAWWIWMPAIGYMPDREATDTVAETISGHLLWPLSHANVWHLAGNLWVLWCLKGRLHLSVSYVMAVACSFLPVVPGLWDIFSLAEPASTVGFSGVLCASIGVSWGEWIAMTRRKTDGHGGYKAYWTFAKRVLPFVAVGVVIPHVNWSIHLYCLLAGMVYGGCDRVATDVGNGGCDRVATDVGNGGCDRVATDVGGSDG